MTSNLHLYVKGYIFLAKKMYFTKVVHYLIRLISGEVMCSPCFLGVNYTIMSTKKKIFYKFE